MPRRVKLPIMNFALRKSWTQEEFFSWAQHQESRYEFDGFQPVAMTGGSNNAGAIGVNFITALRTRLRGSGCRPLGPDNGIETINRAVRFPDAFVTCTKFEGDGKTVPDPVVVFEVLGSTPDSIRRDYFEKASEYAAVASILRYVIVEAAKAGLTVLERSQSGEPWRHTSLTSPSDILRMPEIGIEIPVAEIYEDIAFPEPKDFSE